MSDFAKRASELLEPYVEIAAPYLQAARTRINDSCQGLEAWQIIFYAVGTTLILIWIYGFLFQRESLASRTKKSFFRLVRCIPFVRAKIAAELDKTLKDMEETFHKDTRDMGYITALPHKGLSENQVMEDLKKYKAIAKVNWSEGKCSGTVYSGEEKLTKLMSKVYGEFAWTNPLHPDVFPDIRKMEAEVVQMTCTMFNGGPKSCGSMTSGGTESIMLAIKAYRDLAYEKGIQHPEMVVPVTAHAAFDKGAHFFRVKIIHIPVDEETRRVKVNAMKRAITKNTCMLVASAPSFPHGIMDPVADVAKLGKKYNIPVHVDSCLGGFLVPFMQKAGYKLEPFDFRLPGVTSISADNHKYGFAPKGSSVILYSDPYYRKFQYFVQPDWPGGIYASPTFAGSRAGAIIAACWATMMYIGEQGYIESTKKIIKTTRHIEAELREIEGICVFGKPQVCVIGIGSNHFNIFRLSDALTARGWNLNPLQFPSSVHLCVTMLHTHLGVADKFVSTVREAVAEIMKDPKAKCGGSGAIYGMAQSIPDRSLVSEIAGSYFDAYYSTGDTSVSNGNA